MFVLADISGTVTIDLAIENQSGILNSLLAFFVGILNAGAEKIVAAEADLAGAFLAFQFLKMMMEMGLTKSVVWRAILTFLNAWAWYQVATHAVAIVDAWASWTGSLWAYLSNNSGAGASDIMSSPSDVVTLGWYAVGKMLTESNKFDIFTALTMKLSFLAIGWGILGCYLALGFLVVWITAKAKLDFVFGVALLPFLIEENTRALGAAGLGKIVMAGIQLGSTSLAIGASYAFLRSYTLPDNASLSDGLRLFIGSCGCATLSGGVAALSMFVSKVVSANRFIGNS